MVLTLVAIVAASGWFAFAGTQQTDDLTSRNIKALAGITDPPGPPGEGGCKIYCNTSVQGRCFYDTPNGTAGVCDGVKK